MVCIAGVRKKEKMNQLLARLRNGEVWLAQTSETLLAMDHVGRGTSLEIVFLDAIDLWDDLDKALRGIYPAYQGCVLGSDGSCEPTAVIRCRACAACT